uniref:TROVE domain-containing protein n=1 Tax=Anopheles epiroticus TaxID=199890 RepID=A0A182PEE1_9DIPT
MESVLKTVQRYLYIGSDVPFVLDPPQPLNVEVGKKVLEPLVKPKESSEPSKATKAIPNTSETKAQKKVNPKKKNPTGKQESEKVEKKAEENKSKTPKDAATPSGKASESGVPSKPLHPVLALIKTTYKSKSLRRTDECLFALAYCARNFATPEEQHSVYETVWELIRTSNDLMVFVSYYIQLATQSGHAGFGHGLRCAITRWYDRFTPIELAELLVRSNAHAGWTHKDLIAKVHPKLKCPDKQSLIDAATKRTSQLQQKKAPEKKGKKKKQQKENGTAPPMAAPGKEVVQVNSSKAFKRYQTLLQFKSVSNAGKALELIKLHGAKGRLELLPKHLRRSAKIWEALYPSLTYRELLHAALPLQDFRLLKEGEPNAKAFADSLTKRFDALEAEHIHPIEVQTVAKLYEAGKRYTARVKETMHTMNQTDICPPVKAVLEGLQSAFEHSFNNQPKTGVRYYIALDLRCVHSRKKVFRNEVINCFQASVLLAFSIFKREKSVTVVAFTDDEEILTPVAFEPTMSWEQAIGHCTGLMLPKTKVSLAAPIKQAEAQKLKVDVFITITDSLIRVNPTRRPPVAELTEYRKKAKLTLCRSVYNCVELVGSTGVFYEIKLTISSFYYNFRYLAISLSRHEPSLDFAPDKDTVGILEMAGHSANNAKLIDAFAKNLFV